MSIKERYIVRSIDSGQCKEWLLYKHYAHRIPPIEYSFGLFDNKILVGVCTFATPPRVMNNGESVFNDYSVKTLELNRLVVNDNLLPNSLSFFVGCCLNMIPTPCCVVSYADFTRGHNGYIYQATNWIYTGLNQIHEREWFDTNGNEINQRTLSSMGLTSAEKKLQAGMSVGDYTKKHRYFKFLGNKREIRQMMSKLKYQILPYPKGDNTRYNSSYQPTVQGVLF